MKYTIEELQGKSDHELNILVAEKEGLSVDYGYGFVDSEGKTVCFDLHNSKEVRINYCNSWADMGPIISANKISIAYRARGDRDLPPQAKRFGVDDHSVVDSNELRAAAIVYLMMGE